ncbi:nuclear transport factor 2 family protein [Cyanobium sp. NS01]|uniref:nuclear transport factor 2 family protein n=1 Tax=Cyanobium sp. NS01 TaxID=261284 RepID=UPI00164730D8|nr:nuclear transport factor 2 family protein [Cyanobium sp. NS01]
MRQQFCSVWPATLAGMLVFAAIPQCGRAQPPSAASDPAPGAPLAQALPSDPGAVVRQLLEAMTSNDPARIRALFAANASQAYGNGPAKSGEDFFRWLDSDIIERGGRVNDPQVVVTGNDVVVTGQYNSRGYTSRADFLFRVEDGRIVSWRMRY